MLAQGPQGMLPLPREEPYTEDPPLDTEHKPTRQTTKNSPLRFVHLHRAHAQPKAGTYFLTKRGLERALRALPLFADSHVSTHMISLHSCSAPVLVKSRSIPETPLVSRRGRSLRPFQSPPPRETEGTSRCAFRAPPRAFPPQRDRPLWDLWRAPQVVSESN